MPENILGLDIGHKTIKAVLLGKKGLTGGRIIAFSILDIDATGGMEPALHQLAENRIFSEATCLVLLPSNEIIFRQVHLPFHEDHKIRKTLPFELEPLIPLPVEETVTDYLKIPDNEILVAAITKQGIRQWIEKLENKFRGVPVIDTSATALAVQVIDKNIPCGIILDIGAHFTTAVFYENGSLIHVRTLAFGGENITQALVQDMSLRREEAEKLKIDANFHPPLPKTLEQCRTFCLELKNTVEYLKINGLIQNEPARLTVTGGGALFTPLIKTLEETLSCPITFLDISKNKDLEIEEHIKADFHPLLMNTALAAALRFSAGRKSLNLRQGEFAPPREKLNLRRQLKWAAVAGTVILVLGVANQVLDYSLKNMRLNHLKKQASFIFKKHLPEAGPMVDPVQQLKTKREENKKTLGFSRSCPMRRWRTF